MWIIKQDFILVQPSS